jgi:hypothetical protein
MTLGFRLLTVNLRTWEQWSTSHNKTERRTRRFAPLVAV